MIGRVLAHELEENLRFSPAVGLLGPRQVGKTTLARHLANSRESKWFDLQRASDIARLEEAEQVLPQLADQLVVIDEIQLMPSLFGLLRPLIDENRRPGRFLLLGSASPKLIRGASESLAGRISYSELSPVSLLEIENESIDFKQHLISGGYPEPLLQLPANRRERWYRDFIRTYIARDLAELGLGVADQAFGRLLRMVAYAQGGIFNASAFASSLTITNDTVRRYVFILEESFLVRSLQPWLPNLKKRLVKSPRIFIRDSGLVTHLLGINDYIDLLGRPEAGATWEGYVIEEICRVVGDKAEPYFYRSGGGAELDLVLDFKSYQLAFEIKLSTAPKLSRGFYSAMADLKPKETYVVSPPSGTSYAGKNGEIYIGLPELLQRLQGEVG